ncbi:MAG: ATP-binding protein [Candidatus Paceibacterota bacterium]
MDGTLAIGLNAGLLSVSAVAALLISMGFVVFLSDMESLTHRSFLALTGTSVIWSVFNYAIYKSSDPTIVLWLLRFIMFAATWFACALFTFFYVFPNRQKMLPTWYRFILFPSTTVVALLTLTPLVFRTVNSFSASGEVQQVTNGPGIFLFGVLVFILDFGAIFLLARKTIRARGAAGNPYYPILIGTITTISLIIIFSFIFPAFFGNSTLVAYGTLFLLPFIGLTAYAIDRGHVLNVKEIGVALLVSALAIATLVELIFTTDPTLILFRISLFILILLVGLLLIRGVVREVKQREKIEELAKELEATNARQEGLIHFIGHEVKGSLTKDEGAFAALADGDFGQLQDGMKTFIERALAESRQGVNAVTNILTASNLKKGTVTHVKEPFDLKALVVEAVEKAKPAAEKKGLTLSFIADDASYQMTGDKAQIEDHVLRNLIDNAVNYTPSGSIDVLLKKENGKIIFSVKDTGIGITEEDKRQLFTEGGHGKESQTINVHSTGYGLYIAKQIVEAEGGTIRAESLGAGKGSTFVVEFPI